MTTAQLNDPERDGGAAVGIPVDRTVGPCLTERDSWGCKNMLPVDGDTSMTHEHYACTVCGRRMALDYEEMR